MATKIDPKLIEQALGQLGPAPAAGPVAGLDGIPAAAASTTAAPATTFIVQFATPDGAAVDRDWPAFARQRGCRAWRRPASRSAALR
jgi:hypothetical protein